MASQASFLSSASSFTTQPISTKKPPHPRHFPKSISCKSNEIDGNNIQENKSSSGRRDLLISLGGLYGAASSFVADPRLAIANPIQAPDLSKCKLAISEGGTPVNCCPPFDSTIIDFVPPRYGPLRVRPAAHLIDDDYLKKYEKAVQLMKALPADDPRNFTQQAKIHCAYCDGAYPQINHPTADPIQVHYSWLFFPFHRLYLYFHERILGKLIGDDSFAIPFWNWDCPNGMMMPAFYNNKSSILYNVNRNPNHLPPVTIDLDGKQNSDISKYELVEDNLITMYKEMISKGKNARLFMGHPYKSGDDANPGAGSLELVPHNTIHDWTGNPANQNSEDMGALYSAARDPIFYAHHANIDRLWSVWTTLGGKRRNFKDDDWLNSSFLFHDENAQLVKVKVRDCVNSENLGYKYQDVENLWLKKRPKPKAASAATNSLSKKKAPTVLVEPEFPITLNKPVSVFVKRPKKGRSQKEKEDEEEVLLVQDIVVSRQEFTKFDVYINSPEEEKLRPSASEFAGCFVSLPHKHGNGMKAKDLKTNLNLGITDLLEDLGAEDDDSVVVTLVPKSGNGNQVKVGGLRIEFSS